MSNSGEPALLKACGKGDPQRVQLLLDLGINVDCRSALGKRSPLAVASWHGNIECVKALIEGKANVNSRDAPGLSPLHLAFSPVGVSLNCEAIVEILVGAGANVDLVTNKGETAAHFAARQGELKALKILANAGADLSISTDDGQTCLDWAKIHRQTEVVQYLMSGDLTHKRRTPSNRNEANTSDSDDEFADVFAKKSNKTFNSVPPRAKVPTRMPMKITVGSDSGVGHVDCLSPDLQSETYVKTQNNHIVGPMSPGTPELQSEIETTQATFNALDSYALFKTIVEEQFDGSLTEEDELLLTEMIEMGFDDADEVESKEDCSATQLSSDTTDDDSQSSISGNETQTNSEAGSNVTQLGQFENELLKQENANLRETLAQYQDLIAQLSTHVEN